MRSNECDSGRNESAVNLPSMSSTAMAASTFDAMLWWVSITPLGVPVVPLV